MVATWVQATGCGTRYEELTADGQVHVDYAFPFGESYSGGDDKATALSHLVVG
ncbi:hypothetical protein [Streptomyces niveus]|uniref:hypothetical protein n=1 Tax=Streptomyces niveus TaxID=193462 RepID=UPI0033A068AF